VEWQPNTLTFWDYQPYSRRGERVSVVDGKAPSR
jgi:hypothetical protein